MDGKRETNLKVTNNFINIISKNFVDFKLVKIEKVLIDIFFQLVYCCEIA